MEKNDSLFLYGGFAAQSEEQIEYFKNNRIYSIQIEATDACQQGCLYCYAGSTPKEKNSLSSNKIKEIIYQAAQLGVRMIDWLGGDPLLRPDWTELMFFVNSLGLKNNIWTSGLPLADMKIASKAYELTNGGYVSIHLDSLDPKIYSQLHPRQGIELIERIKYGLNNLLKSGKKPENIFNCLTFTSLQESNDAKKTIKWFWTEKGIRTCLVLFKTAGFGMRYSYLEPDILEIQKAYTFRNNLNYGDCEYVLGTQDVTKFYCGTMVCITFNGDVTPCSVIRSGLGNIFQQDFLKIIARKKDELIMADMHNQENLPGYCKRCKNNCICWGCRANSWNKLHNLTVEDPCCWFNKDNMEA